MRHRKSGLIAIVVALVPCACGCEKAPAPQATQRASLHEAALNGNIELIRDYIAAGVDVDARDTNDATPLYEAIAMRELEAAQALLDAGADIDAPGPFDRTALYLAFMQGDVESIDFLVEREASIHVRDADDSTLLHALGTLRMFMFEDGNDYQY